MFTYKIVEENADPLQSVIEKSGITSRFSLMDTRQERARAEKLKKGFLAQINLENAKLDNIERNHEIVKTLTPQQIFAVQMYYNAKTLKETMEAKVAEIDALIVEDDAEEKAIAEQIGVAIPKSAVEEAPKTPEANA